MGSSLAVSEGAFYGFLRSFCGTFWQILVIFGMFYCVTADLRSGASEWVRRCVESTSRSLAAIMAEETSEFLMEKVPPKPQQRSRFSKIGKASCRERV